jgi:hypothetical protein
VTSSHVKEQGPFARKGQSTNLSLVFVLTCAIKSFFVRLCRCLLVRCRWPSRARRRDCHRKKGRPQHLEGLRAGVREDRVDDRAHPEDVHHVAFEEGVQGPAAVRLHVRFKIVKQLSCPRSGPASEVSVDLCLVLLQFALAEEGGQALCMPLWCSCHSLPPFQPPRSEFDVRAREASRLQHPLVGNRFVRGVRRAVRCQVIPSARGCGAKCFPAEVDRREVQLLFFSVRQDPGLHPREQAAHHFALEDHPLHHPRCP